MSEPGTGRTTAISVAAVLVAMVSIQAGAALAKQLFPAIGPGGATGLRLTLACVLLAVVFRPWRARLDARQRRLVLAYGLLLGVMNFVFYLAVARVPLGIVVAIEFGGPLAVAVAASRRPLDFACAVLAVCGIALFLPVVKGAPALDPLGLLFAVLAGICWGVYILLGRRLGSVAPGTVTSLGMVVATAVVLPLAWAQAGARLLDPALLPVGLAVAVLSSGLPYTLELIAMKHMPARTFGIFMSVEPAIAALAGLVVLGERLTPTQLVATACVVLASAGSAVSGAEPVHVEESVV